MNQTSSRGLAAQILYETAVAHPDALKQWTPLRDVRDKILHPFDRERLRLSYKAGNAWDALKDAAKSLPWLEVRGEGLDTEVRAKYIPYDTFTSLEEALDRIRHLDVVFAHWKEVGHKLLLAEESLWNMREHLRAGDERVMRALALIFHYKVLATELREQAIQAGAKNLRNVEPPDQATLDAMWQNNPSSFGPLKIMLADTGILDRDEYEDTKED